MRSVDHFAIVGAGSLGQAFSALLAANGRVVTLLASTRAAEQLWDAGAVRLRGAVSLDVPVAAAPAEPGHVGVTANPAELPAKVGLFFATKGHQLPAAIEAVRAVWPATGDQESWVAGLQNGLVKDDLLARAFGPDRVVGAATILSAGRQANGTVTVASRGATYLGEFPSGRSPRVESTAAIFREAGIPTEAVDNVSSVLWSKALNAVGVFGVCVLARSSSTAMGRSPDLVRAYLSLIQEAAAVAGASGVELGDYAGFPIRTYVDSPRDDILARFAAHAAPPGAPESFPSMVQDLLAGRPLESEAIFADMVERAQKIGVPVPRIELVRDIARGIATNSGHSDL